MPTSGRPCASACFAISTALARPFVCRDRREHERIPVRQRPLVSVVVVGAASWSAAQPSSAGGRRRAVAPRRSRRLGTVVRPAGSSRRASAGVPPRDDGDRDEGSQCREQENGEERPDGVAGIAGAAHALGACRRAERQAALDAVLAARRRALRTAGTTVTTGLSSSAWPHEGQKRVPGAARRSGRSGLRRPGRSARRAAGRLADALLERDELRGLLVDDVLAELVLPVHLEHEPAEVVDSLLAVAQEGAPLAAEPAGGGR